MYPSARELLFSGEDTQLSRFQFFMDFNDAISALKAGDKVRRAAWVKNALIYVNSAGALAAAGGQLWNPTIESLAASDWMIHVPHPGEQ